MYGSYCSDCEIYLKALWDHKSKGQTFLIYDVEPRLPLVHYWSFVYVHPDAGQVRDILAATNGRKIEDCARKEGERLNKITRGYGRSKGGEIRVRKGPIGKERDKTKERERASKGKERTGIHIYVFTELAAWA